MLYYNLAESLNELEMLAVLVDKMDPIEKPLFKLLDRKNLHDEIQRIIVKADVDILFFGIHSAIYLNHNISKINALIIHLLEILSKLPPIPLMNEKERCHYEDCRRLRRELNTLSLFFNKLREQYAS